MSTVRPIALQLYTIREAMAADWVGTLEKIAALGYVGVETAGFSYASAPEAKAQFDRLGLQVVAAHAPLPLGEAQPEILQTMEILGCKRLICPGTGRDKFGSLEDIKGQAARFNEANAIARAQGLDFGLHNHYWEFSQIGEQLGFDILLEELDESIFFEIDAYWAAAAGLDAAALLTRLGQRVPLLHVKDGSTKIEDAMVAVGAGVMDYHTIISATAAVEWHIVELDHCDSDMMTAVTESYRYLTSEGLSQGNK